jgi:hypothetical protein
MAPKLLSPERDVPYIRAAVKLGAATQKQLARRYRVSTMTISHIVNRKTFKDIPDAAGMDLSALKALESQDPTSAVATTPAAPAKARTIHLTPGMLQALAEQARREGQIPDDADLTHIGGVEIGTVLHVTTEKLQPPEEVAEKDDAYAGTYKCYSFNMAATEEALKTIVASNRARLTRERKDLAKTIKEAERLKKKEQKAKSRKSKE